MDEVRGKYLDMDKVEVKDVVEAAVVAVVAMVEAVEEEAIIIVTKTI